jgi:hypothetical protein
MSTPRKTPRQQRSEFTFDAILDAAARLFHQHGCAGTARVGSARSARTGPFVFA